MRGGQGRYALLAVAMDRAARRAQRQKEIALLIRTLRHRADMTQEDLAREMTRLGDPTSRSQVSMWEMPGPQGNLPDLDKFLTILEATEPRDQPETAADRQGRFLRRRLTDLRHLRAPRDDDARQVPE